MPIENTLVVTIEGDASEVVRAFDEAAKTLRAYCEAWLALLPWYRRWPIRIRVWISTQVKMRR